MTIGMTEPESKSGQNRSLDSGSKLVKAICHIAHIMMFLQVDSIENLFHFVCLRFKDMDRETFNQAVDFVRNMV